MSEEQTMVDIVPIQVVCRAQCPQCGHVVSSLTYKDVGYDMINLATTVMKTHAHYDQQCEEINCGRIYRIPLEQVRLIQRTIIQI